MITGFNMSDSEKNLIKKIKNIDAEISETKKRIECIVENEEDLNSALKTAKSAENKAMSNYASAPNERSQLSLKNARDFVGSCQKRVNAFTNDESVLNSDVIILWQQRKSIMGELTRFRENKLRPSLEREAAMLIKNISEKSIRYLVITALLEGQNVLRLDMKRLLEKYNQHHKQDLIDAKKELDEYFSALTMDEV